LLVLDKALLLARPKRQFRTKDEQVKNTIFQQILKPITKDLMKACCERFQSDYRYESFNTLEHLKTMVYAQINEIKSLRTLEVAINSQKIGIKTKVKRTTLSDANKKRSADCFFWILEHLISLLPRKKCKEMRKVIRILDSSPIQLKGQGYDEWSKKYATRHIQGLKLHTEYDLVLNSPLKIMISHANVNDASMGKCWPIMKETIYVFDKGYYDYNWWWSIHQKQAYFVTRLKKNAAIILEDEQPTPSNDSIILKDGYFRISNKVPRGGKRMNYSETLRSITVKREGKKPLVLVTNLKNCSAENIADLYKARWKIELFFKWIKQNLKIKKFLGKSENAVKIQIASGLIAYLLVQLFQMQLNNRQSLRLFLTWIKYNLSALKSYKNNHKPPAYHLLEIKQAGGVHL
jgi:putative transposase